MSFFGQNYSKNGAGISKDAPEKRGFFRFIDIISVNYSKLIGLNLLYTLCSLPVFAVYFCILSFLPWSSLGIGAENAAMNVTLVTAIISVFLVLTLGSGIFSPGFIYIIRNFSRREHSFIVSDFFEQTRKNLKQSIPVMLIDFIMIFIVCINANIFIAKPEIFGGFVQIFKLLTVVFALIYMMARMYLYTLAVTFEASVWKIYRFSFLLCIYKLPQNILIFAITLGIFFLFTLLPFTLFAFLITPLVLFSFIALAQMMYTYMVIDSTLEADKKEDKPESIFKD